MTSQARAPGQAAMARQAIPAKAGDSRNLTAMPESKRAPFAGQLPFVQLKCACGGSGPGECESCKEKKRLQRKGTGSAGPMAVSPALPSGGQGLSAPLRGQMEGAFGHSFAGVRVHHDAAAHQAAQSLHAHALTVGQDVYFARGQFAPESRQGLRLLAHELSHTVQQRGLSTSVSPMALQADDGGYAIDPVDAPLEREADAAADRVLSGGRPQVSLGAAVGVARAAKVQALLQREPDSDTATVTTPKVNHRATTITRTVERRPCRNIAETQSTPRGEILYWDTDAQAMGFRYQICNGKVKLETGGEIQYDQLVSSAKTLLGTVLSNPTSLGTALQDAVNTTQITGNGSAVLTVDGVLQASVTSEAAAGTQAQSFNVKGKLIVAPNGSIRFQVDGGVGIDKNALGKQNDYTLSGTIGNDRFSVSLQYQQIDFSPTGGGQSTTDRNLTGTVGIGLGRGTNLTISGSGSSVNDATVIFGLSGRIGSPSKPPPVKCYRCDCPPPLPKYRCQTVVDPHEEKEITRKADKKTFRMLQVYDNTQPLEPTTYKGQVSEIVGLLKDESAVASITGHASPEASVEYNQKLSEKRAKATKSAIQAELTKQSVSASLPDITVGGELHGDSSAHEGEAKNGELTTELQAELAALPDDEGRLNFLQIEGERRTDPVKRAETIADINAFINGKAGKKSASGREPLWEKIFPYMRRTDVLVEVREKSKMNPVPGDPGKVGNCDQASLQYALEHMPALDLDKRLPTDQC